MNFPKPETVQKLRDMYPKDSWVMLLKMTDKYPHPVAGSVGQATHVDDLANVHVSWENGSSLSAAWPEDVIVKLDPEYWNLIRDAYSQYTLAWMKNQGYGADDFVTLVSEWQESLEESFAITKDTTPLQRASFCQFVCDTCCPESVYSFSEFIEKMFLSPDLFGKYLYDRTHYVEYLEKILPTASCFIKEKVEKKLVYPYIMAWGLMLGSLPGYIDDEIAKAMKDNAPQNATFKRNDGVWSTTEDISSPGLLAELDNYIEGMKRGMER